MKLRWLIALTAVAAGPAAGADEFQVKGFRLGAPVSPACDEAKERVELSDLVAKATSAGVSGLKKIDATFCTAPVATFAELGVEGGVANLLFVDGALAQAKLELEAVPTMDGWRAIIALRDVYGRPAKNSRRDGFQTQTWRQGSHELAVTIWGADNLSKVEIVLRDVKAFNRYMLVANHNSKVFDQHGQRSRAGDTR